MLLLITLGRGVRSQPKLVEYTYSTCWRERRVNVAPNAGSSDFTYYHR